MNNWLEPELQRGLRSVSAPDELWDRIQSAQSSPRPQNRSFVWAMAAAVAVAAVGLSAVRAHRDNAAGDEAFAIHALTSDSRRVAFHCQNPAQLRAWVKAKTGLDIPLRPDPPGSIQLIGAASTANGAEISYRAADQNALLLVSRADGATDVPHDRASGNVSSWVMAGRRFTLAADTAADLQIACKLCHLD